MLNLLKVLCIMLLVVPVVSSRITLTPSDDTAGGGSGDIYWFMHFGSHAATWPTTDSCLRTAGGGSSHRPCQFGAAPDSLNIKAYFGTPFVRYLACSPAQDHTLWGSSASLSVALHETQGSNTEGNQVQSQIGGALTFDETEGVGVAKRLIINTRTTLSGGQFQVKFTAVGSAPTAPIDNGIICVVALVE